MQNNFYTSIVIIALFIGITACYSSDVVTVQEFRQIEKGDKPDEIHITTKDSIEYHFVKPDYYVKNDTLFGEKKIVLNDKESVVTKKIALADIEYIQIETTGWVGKKIPAILPKGKNIPSEKNQIYLELLGNGII
jgi:hypothetical protein